MDYGLKGWDFLRVEADEKGCMKKRATSEKVGIGKYERRLGK